MNRVLGIAVAMLATTVMISAQATHPLIMEANENYARVKANMIRMAEKMPDDQYGFRPVPDIRSFGESLAHVADAQTTTCGLVLGDPKRVDAASKRTKTEFITALKDSFSLCDAALAGTTDATIPDMVRLGQSSRYRSRMGLLTGMIAHTNEMYGYLSVYMRLKGLVPPSSEPGQ